jgi:hypothetical protein
MRGTVFSVGVRELLSAVPVQTTRNCMMSKVPLLKMMFSPVCWLKSKMMSGRSAGVSRMRFIFMGDERRPWSLLTWCMGERLPKDRRKKRAFEPFMRRRRYLRGWTSR